MSAIGGPNIVEDGLVLALDAANVKSFRGEPTTNEFVNVGGDVRSTWAGDGANQASFTKGFDIVSNPSLKYNNYDTVLWRPGASLNCYLHSSNVNSSRTSATWVFSCYIRREDGGTLRQSDNNLQVYLYFPNSDGSTTGTIENVGNGWYRVSRTRTGTSANITLAGFTGFAANFKYYLSGWILEKKTEPTKFWIPTDTTRGTTVATGGGWADRSGNSNHGELVNGPTFDNDNLGSIVFDGVDDYIIGNSNLGILGDDYFTISYFARWNGPSFSTNFPSAVGNNSTGSTNRGLSTTWREGRIALDFWVNRFRANSALNVQTWYHATFTKTAGLIGSTTKLYVNGEEVSGSVEGTNTAPNVIDSPVIIGRLDSTRWFNGKISSVKIYNRALSAAEVLQNYNATKARYNL